MDNITKKYIGWMALNSCITSCSNVLSTNTMLNSLLINPSCGVATFTYIGKDILGQLGCLLYSWKNGNKSDKTPMSHITKGVFFQQAGFHLENASHFIKDDFIIPFLGISNVTKNISFISFGAVNSSNLYKLAKNNNNIGELYSKVASINTITSSIGMLVGLGIIFFVPSYTIRSYIILPCLSIGSFYSVRKATNITDL